MMDYHAFKCEAWVFLYSDEIDMGKYDRIDPQAVVAQRRADIKEGKPITPKESCHYCGSAVPRLALWCSSACAQDHANERAELAGAPDGA